MARDRYSLAKPAYEKGLSYYSALAGGDQAKAAQVMAPDIRAITDTYRGGQSSIENRLQGPARDQALADLARSRTADIAALAGRGRTDAVSKLFGAGESGLGDAMSGLMSALGGEQSVASGARNMLGDERARKQQLFSLFSQLGTDVFKLWAPYLQGGSRGQGISLPGQTIDFTKLGYR